MSGDTDFVTKAERGIGVLIYRSFIGLCMTSVVVLGGWNLSETHGAAVIVRGLEQHMKDSDKEMTRIAKGQDDMAKTVQEIKDREVQDLKDHAARLDTRVSVIETEIDRKKP